jgi:hypothetical protein
VTTTLSEEPVSAPAGYPVRLMVERPQRQSRLTNFPLFVGDIIRAILLIPHFVILYLFGLVAALVYFIATFAILFTGSFPRGLFNLVEGYQRWTANATGYMYHLYDKYPPFSPDPQAGYPLTFEVGYPERSSRLLNFPLFGWLIKLFIAIPHWLVLMFLSIAAAIVLFIAAFVILFTGAFPGGMHAFVTGVMRWSTRLNAYFYGLTDRYPPFSTS